MPLTRNTNPAAGFDLAALAMLATLANLAASAVLLATPARADDGPTEAPAGEARFSYALGAAVLAAPTYIGSGGQEVKLRPLWSVRYGRFRLSGARASGLLAAPGDAGSGASADLIDSPTWKVGAALRFDTGRASSDDVALSGLPDVRRTLRARVYASRDLGGNLGPGWLGQLGYSQDLLGRGGGGLANTGLVYSWAVMPGLEASASAGLTWADGQHMRTYFGIAPEVAQATGRTAYGPGAGLRDAHAGLGLRQPLGGRWVLWGGVAASQLLGQAADSPLTRQKTGYSASVALAWRSN